MKTKIFGLALATTLTLAACSNDGASEDDTDDAGTPAEPVEDSQGDEQTDDSGSDNSDDSNDDSNNDSGSNNNSSASSSEAIAIGDVNLSPEDAIEIAQGEFDGDLYEIQLDQDRGDWVYNVDLRSADEEAEVTINQETEEVVDVRTESENDYDDDNEILDYSSVSSIEEAFEVASSDAGGGDISEWTLDMDDGRAEYNIDLLYENEIYEYTIDADSLEIVESEHDDNDDDDD